LKRNFNMNDSSTSHHDGSDTHVCVPCLRRSGFAQAGETLLRRAGTADEKLPGN